MTHENNAATAGERHPAKRPPVDPFIGRTLADRYVIRALLARGGFGIVYLATCLNDDSDVVMKLLSDTWAGDEEAAARFEREAKRLSSLRHPNIVSMLDYGQADGRAYLVTEYVPGELLGNFVARHGRLSLDVFVPIAAQILKGVGEAHARHLMIRDIKANNVMLCELKNRANFVKLLDFGLAKRLHGETRVTEAHVMGTIGYLAPEAIRGEEPDLRVDVYSLGVLFYFMLSGVLPFDGNSDAAVIYKTVNEEARNLQQVIGPAQPLPEGLVDLVHACLAKDREQRPADANAIIEAMIDVLPGPLFRLPRVMPRADGRPIAEASHIDSSFLSLIGLQASGAHNRLSSEASSSSAAAMMLTGFGSTWKRRRVLLWLGALACGVLGLGATARAIRGTDPTTAAASVEPLHTTAAASVELPPTTAAASVEPPRTTTASAARDQQPAAAPVIPARTPPPTAVEPVETPAETSAEPPSEPAVVVIQQPRRDRHRKPHGGDDTSDDAPAPTPTRVVTATEASAAPGETPAPDRQPVFLPARARGDSTEPVFLPAGESKKSPSELMDDSAQ